MARVKQLHTCEPRRCLVPSKDRGMVCKRRAPFPISEDDFVSESGEWGMRRVHPFELSSHKQSDHTERTPYFQDLRNQQRLLLFRLVHTINREQELAAPMVMSYLMGWGDTYRSHHYTPIYWSSFVFALLTAFPCTRTRSVR